MNSDGQVDGKVTKCHNQFRFNHLLICNNWTKTALVFLILSALQPNSSITDVMIEAGTFRCRQSSMFPVEPTASRPALWKAELMTRLEKLDRVANNFSDEILLSSSAREPLPEAPMCRNGVRIASGTGSWQETHLSGARSPEDPCPWWSRTSWLPTLFTSRE